MNFHSIKSKMWSSRNGTYRTILRNYDDSTAIVASYLMSSPHARQSGIYSCPINYIASETERSAADVEQCLVNLEEVHFCKYDFEEEVVWIFKMVEYQVSPHWTQMKRDVNSHKKQDSRYQGVLNSLNNVAYSCLHDEFCKFWNLDLDAKGGADNTPEQNSTVGDRTRGVHGAYRPPHEKGPQEGSERASKWLHGGDS